MSSTIVTLYLAGLFGSLGMDLISPLAERQGYRTGVTIALIGRWFIGILSGTLLHTDIRQSPPCKHEVLTGWLFHYLIGGGAVALLLLPWLWQSEVTQLPTAPLPYLLFGLATSALPWLILMPSFGWGWFGRHAPAGSRPLIASPLNHLGYGIGLWLGATAIMP
jgi:hypothetical protein